MGNYIIKKTYERSMDTWKINHAKRKQNMEREVKLFIQCWFCFQEFQLLYEQNVMDVMGLVIAKRFNTLPQGILLKI